MKWRDDAGAALVTVLVMLAIMATLAVVVVDAARFSIARTANQALMGQARWYLIGAESYAAGRIAQVAKRDEKLPIDEGAWQGRTFQYPLDDGLMTITIWDGSNCFNLNSVVERTEEAGYVGSSRGQIQLARLLDTLEVRVEGGLASALADWIDTDQRPSPSGAEDSAYAHTPYRTANTLIADLSELRRVRGFSDAIVARLAPFVCVRPTEAPNVLNVNSLRPNQAPLLAMVVPGLTPGAAAEILRDRPHGGWATLDAFFGHPRLIGLELNEQTRAQFAITSTYYVMQAQVTRDGFSESSAALIQMNSGQGKVLRRLFGAGGDGSLGRML